MALGIYDTGSWRKGKMGVNKIYEKIVIAAEKSRTLSFLDGYNWGMPIASTEVSVPLIPASVVYDPDSLTADVTFKITQNSEGNGTIDLSHVMFRFYGKDAYGKAMDLTADEYSGISKIV